MIDRSSHIRTALRRSQRGYLLDPYRFGSAAPAQAWDPANKDADITLSAADQLATIVSALGTVRSVTSHAAAGANHYGEIEIARTDTAGRPVALVGIVTAGVSLTNTYPGGTANSGSTQALAVRSSVSTMKPSSSITSPRISCASTRRWPATPLSSHAARRRAASTLTRW